VAADNGFQDCHIEPEIAAHNFESLHLSPQFNR
jgi:hypothetical protein